MRCGGTKWGQDTEDGDNSKVPPIIALGTPMEFGGTKWGQDTEDGDNPKASPNAMTGDQHRIWWHQMGWVGHRGMVTTPKRHPTP